MVNGRNRTKNLGPLAQLASKNESCCSKHFGRVDLKHSKLVNQAGGNSHKHFEGEIEQRLSGPNTDGLGKSRGGGEAKQGVHPRLAI